MNKFSYKILFYILLFFLLIKNIYYINIEKFENILIFFITYIICYFFIDNDLVKVYLCIIIPEIIFFETIIEGKGNMSNLRDDIKEQGGKNIEKRNEKQEKDNNKLSEEKDEDKVDKKGYKNNSNSSEKDLENLVS
tara:strand:- start:771 stop:1178 length:408 start_codon:yes stop_codon:yes gene_type:complete